MVSCYPSAAAAAAADPLDLLHHIVLLGGVWRAVLGQLNDRWGIMMMPKKALGQRTLINNNMSRRCSFLSTLRWSETQQATSTIKVN